MTYSALNHAAEIIANRVSDVLGDTAGGRLLLSDEIERGAGAGSCRRSELTRGLATLPSSRPPRRRAGLGGFHLGRQVPGVLAARPGVRLERPQPRSGEDERA